MNRIFFAIPVLAAAGLAFACGSDDSGEPNETKDEMDDGPFTLGEPSSETQEVIAEIDGYQSWSQFEATSERPASEGHMNMFVQSFYNEMAGAAMADGTLPLPNGSVLVKEAYMKADDTSPMALTIMSKRGGEWYWAQVTPDGQLMLMDDMPLEGRNVEMCVGCHADAASDNDLVATPFP